MDTKLYSHETAADILTSLNLVSEERKELGVGRARSRDHGLFLGIFFLL